MRATSVAMSIKYVLRLNAKSNVLDKSWSILIENMMHYVLSKISSQHKDSVIMVVEIIEMVINCGCVVGWWLTSGW